MTRDKPNLREEYIVSQLFPCSVFTQGYVHLATIMNRSNKITIIRRTSKTAKKKTTNKSSRRQTQRPRLARTTQLVMAPVASTAVRRQRGPAVSTRNGGLRVQHSIMMQVVTGSASDEYHINPIGLQPGDATHLPWLSRLANNYETYRVVSMTARYVPTCPTTTAGRVLFYWEYDVNDSPAPDYKSASAQWHAIATPPWKGVTVPLDVKKVHAQFPQKRVTTIFSNDFRSDIGVFNICRTAGTTGAWGEVWLDFVFDFRTPTYNDNDDVGPLTIGATTRYEITAERTLPNANTIYNIPLEKTEVEPVIDECKLGTLSAPTGAVENSSLSEQAGGGCVLLPPGYWGIEATFDTKGPYVVSNTPDRINQVTQVHVSTDPTDIRSAPDAVLEYSHDDLPVALNSAASHNSRRNYIYSTFTSDVATYVALAAKLQNTVAAVRTIYANAVFAITWLGLRKRPYSQLVISKAARTLEHYQATGDYSSFVRKMNPHLPVDHHFLHLRPIGESKQDPTTPHFLQHRSQNEPQSDSIAPPTLERAASTSAPPHLPLRKPGSRSASPLRMLSPAPYRSN